MEMKVTGRQLPIGPLDPRAVSRGRLRQAGRGLPQLPFRLDRGAREHPEGRRLVTGRPVQDLKQASL